MRTLVPLFVIAGLAATGCSAPPPPDTEGLAEQVALLLVEQAQVQALRGEDETFKTVVFDSLEQPKTLPGLIPVARNGLSEVGIESLELPLESIRDLPGEWGRYGKGEITAIAYDSVLVGVYLEPASSAWTVIVSFHCGPLCGTGTIYEFTKNGGDWAHTKAGIVRY